MSEDRPTARARLITAAAQLFQFKGYAATGLNDILKAADAPKGSLYHYFPEGKSELAAAAMRGAGAALKRSFEHCYTQTGSSADAITAYGRELSTWLEQSQFKKGSPVSTVALEQTPSQSELGQTIAEVFDDIQNALAKSLQKDGLSETRAQSIALLALSALEGALILARARQSVDPVLIASDEIAGLIRSEMASGLN